MSCNCMKQILNKYLYFEKIQLKSQGNKAFKIIVIERKIFSVSFACHSIFDEPSLCNCIMPKLSEPLTDFSLKLFREIAENEKNSFMSPYSIVTALAMLHAGSDSFTKIQIKDSMFHGAIDDEEEINRSFQKIVYKLNQTDEAFELNTANRLYSDKSYSILQSYLDTVVQYYSSEIVPSDFLKSDEMRKEINDWVSKTTNGKIEDLLPPNFINSDSKMVLVNAIYFKGSWKKEFDESKTEQKLFHLSKEKVIHVNMMMEKNKEFKYGENEQCKVLAIPYKSPDLAMFIFLPNEMYGLEDFVQQLDGKTFMKYCGSVKSGEVEVKLNLKVVKSSRLQTWKAVI